MRACVRECAYFRVHNSSFYASLKRDEDRIAQRGACDSLYRDRSADRAARGRESCSARRQFVQCRVINRRIDSAFDKAGHRYGNPRRRDDHGGIN